MKNLLYLNLLLLAFSACIKDLPKPASGCEPLPVSPAFGWIYKLPDTGYSSPCFNPDNPYEIIYKEQIFADGEMWICKLNFESEEKNYLLRGKLWSSPIWGRNDWIIFTLSDANVYKMKSDGTELTQLTFNGKSFSPIWSYDYSKIYFNTTLIVPDTTRGGIPPPNRAEPVGIAIDLDGNVLDTIRMWNSRTVSFINDSIAFVYDLAGNGVNSELVLINVNTGTRTVLERYDPNLGTATGIVRLNKNRVLWARRDGIFVYNHVDGSVTQLLETCNSNYFLNLSYSQQLEKIIMENKISNPSGDFLYVKSILTRTCPDLSEIESINIP